VKAGGRAQAGQSPLQEVVDVSSRQFRLVQQEQVPGAFEHDEPRVRQQPGERRAFGSGAIGSSSPCSTSTGLRTRCSQGREVQQKIA
jgi:hypothetical protein